MPIEKWRAKGNMYVNRKGAVRGAARSVIHAVGVAGAHYLLFAALSMLLNRRLGVPPVRERESRECWKVWEQTQNASLCQSITTKQRGEPGQHHAALLTHAALVVGSNYIPQPLSSTGCEIICTNTESESTHCKESYWDERCFPHPNLSGRFWF